MTPRLRRGALAATCGLAFLGLAACGAYRTLTGENTISLRGAELLQMAVSIRRTPAKICPREPVQMWVRVEARLEGETAVRRLETWAGNESARRNEMLDFGNFTFASRHGTVDEIGWFHPNPDVLATVDTGFEIRTAFRYRPDRLAATPRYEPDYACITAGGRAGRAGTAGSDGTSGSSGRSGSRGAPGGPGAPGGEGDVGESGEPGPRFDAYATYVRTRYYERVIAIRLVGAVNDLLLAPPDRAITLVARGGHGGRGGQGGTGGDGGYGGDGRPGGPGGGGGPGGPGGIGGDGGSGGSIVLVYDSRFPELARLVQLDVSGGSAGAGGPGGSGGSGGNGGDGLQGSRGGPGGPVGVEGSSAPGGRPGRRGTSRTAPGAVTDRFRNLPGVEPL